jgi:alpha-tubulin suppressor-like RCC1 family protein
MPLFQFGAAMRQDQAATLNARRKVSLSGLLSILIVSLALIGCSGKEPSEGDKNITAIAAGYEHALALINGRIYAAGLNSVGQLGLGDSGEGTERNRFTEVSSLSGKKIIAIAAGYYHSFVLANDGKVYAAGHNEIGQLGLNDKTNRDRFVAVSSLSGKKIVAIVAGGGHSFAITNDGKVYTTGNNIFGQLGLGNSGDGTERDRFTEVSSLEGKKIIAIVAGDLHSLALDSDGKVYATGYKYDGRLGLGDKSNRDRFVAVSSLSDKKITTIAAGGAQSFAIANDDRVYATGRNHNGQLGLGDTTDRKVFTEVSSLGGKHITAIAAGDWFSLALDSDGKVYTTGNNIFGELGLGGSRKETERDQFTEVSSLKDKKITAIAAGYHCPFAIDSAGKVYTTGNNIFGELGLGDNNDRDEFTEIEFNSAITR